VGHTRTKSLLIATMGLSVLAACSSSQSAGPSETRVAAPDPAQTAQIEAVARESMDKHNLRALIVNVTKDGQDVYTGATGTSMTGVPATADMHFRSGSFGFTYIGQIFAKLVDQGEVSLDDPLSTWLPDLPKADKITVKNLLNMTSGYADYVYQPSLQKDYYGDPFQQWTNEQLIDIGVSAPMLFEPGTNWAYSHTNYVLLGEVLEKITGKPMADVMQEYIIDSMDLTGTSTNGNTPAIPEPVLHSFSSERREFLKIPASVGFYEEATFWNPSWTTAEGAVLTSTISDLTRSMTIVGSGEQVSPEMYQQQVGQNLVGFGKADPTGKCEVCRENTEAGSYGLGVVLLGPWITQTMNFGGTGATSGYLPSDELTISVATTYEADAFDSEGSYANASSDIFAALTAALAPDQALPQPTG
jgi:CubicO group peptidase (beta-lactamase class C family)